VTTGTCVEHGHRCIARIVSAGIIIITIGSEGVVAGQGPNTGIISTYVTIIAHRSSGGHTSNRGIASGEHAQIASVKTGAIVDGVGAIVNGIGNINTAIIGTEVSVIARRS